VKWSNPFSMLWRLLCPFSEGNAEGESPVPVEETAPTENHQKGEDVRATLHTEESAEPTGQFTQPPAAVVPASPPVIVPLDKVGRQCLKDIRRWATWDGPEGEENLRSALKLFQEAYPGHETEVEEAVARGQAIRRVYQQAYKFGGSGRTQEFERLLEENAGILSPEQSANARARFEKGRAAEARFRSERGCKHGNKPLTAVKKQEKTAEAMVMPPTSFSLRRAIPQKRLEGVHPNDLRAQTPRDHWQVIIDESGTVFDAGAHQARQQKLGRFVGVLLPAEGRALPQLQGGWHAVDKDLEEIDRVVQSVLNAPVGVFGFTVRSVPRAAGERWMDGVALLVDWILRLLPVTKETLLEVLIEQRGNFSAGQSWDLVQRECLRRLALAFPDRALRVNLSIRVIGKEGSPFNGYADAIAFTWARTTDASKARLENTGWDGTCLVSTASEETDARTMLHAWDAFAQGVNLPPAAWWDMLGSPEAGAPTSLLHTLLDLVGDEACADTCLWGSLLAEVKGRMASSPVDLRRLGAAVDWLQCHMPKDAAVPPMMRLVWLTVQLARANHHGATEEEWGRELEELENALFDEAAPLVCHAALHRAVASTNRYDFAGAGAALERWKDVASAVPGLRYWGQLISSYGQHAAFHGNNDEAVALFTRALDAFSRLSDAEARRGDELQTTCYLAIALMDSIEADMEAVRKAVERVTGRLPHAAERLARGNSPEDRYAHHLLLRWLANGGDDATARTYTALADSWQVGEGHPWTLIQLYRGFLIRPYAPQEAVELALNAYKSAFSGNQGPTVRLIGAACRTVAALWGCPWEESMNELDRLARDLPLAAQRIESLRTAVSRSADPLRLLAEVLPFNFR